MVGLIALIGSVARSVSAQAEVDRLAQLPAGDAAYGLAVDDAGRIYVSDTSGARNGTILVYTPSGGLYDRLTVPAGSSGLVSLRGLAFDRFGNLYAADSANGEPGRGRIIKITTRGRQSVFASGLTSPGGLAFDRSGILYVTDGLNGSVVWIGQDGASALFVEDERLRPHSRSVGASGLAFAPGDTALYISNVADDRLLKLNVNKDGSAGRLSVLADGSSLQNQGRGSHLLRGVDGILVDDDGNLVVAASLADEIEVFSPEGRLVARLPTDGRSEFASPTGLARSASGRTVYVANLAADNGRSHVSAFALHQLLDG
jgi:DNA-binding beta-propeller fold protein YncE